MKVFFLFLLVAGPFFVRAQGRLTPVWPTPGLLSPNGSPLTRLFPDVILGDSLLKRPLLLSGTALVRVMSPDRMPCLVPVRALADRMPVDRRGNADRMANLP